MSKFLFAILSNLILLKNGKKSRIVLEKKIVLVSMQSGLLLA